MVGRSYSLVCSFQLCYPPTLGRAVASAEALGRTDPLIDSIVGNHHEDVIGDDAKQFCRALFGQEVNPGSA